METRAGKLGRFLAEVVNDYLIRCKSDEEYRRRFLAEINNYSDRQRKKEEQRNSGCVLELERLERFDGSPECLARILKEITHMMYQKQTAKRCREGFLDNFLE